ncbi:MAG: DUF4097 domain-containing protein [Gemmatimonadetes bacterium]|nr:DUF4097 domain-containing protein [Gemmatimonadota bacterium]
MRPSPGFLGSRSTLVTASMLAVVAMSAGAQTDRRTLAGAVVGIHNLVGRVTVEPGSGPDVVIEVTRRGADARRLDIETGDVRGVNSLRVMFPDDDIVYPEIGRWSNSDFTIGRDGTWNGDRSMWNSRRRIRVRGSGRGTEAWADLRVMVPTGKRVEINVGVGEASSRGVEGDLSIDVASARITVSGHKGSLRLDTGSGSVDIRDVTGADELVADAGSGHITLFNASARRISIESGSGGFEGDNVTAEDLDVEVGSGGVRIDRSTAQRVRLETGSGSMALGLRNSPRTLDVESGSGGVTLTLPTNLDADIDVETGSGGITSDFPVQVDRVERRRLHGRVGRGDGRIRVETGSGSVRLRRGA